MGPWWLEKNILNQQWVDALSPWILEHLRRALEKGGEEQCLQIFNRRSRSCAIKNKSGVADCSSLQPFKQFVSWLPSKLTPGSFFWNGTSLRTACLSRQLGSQLPSLDASWVSLLFSSLAILKCFLLRLGTAPCIMYWMLPSYPAERHCFLSQSWHREWKRMGKGCVPEFTACYLCSWVCGMWHV